MHSYFLSDLHLTPERPGITKAFLEFLTNDARSAERIYLLGDLFEYWIGDDAANLIGAEMVLATMHSTSEQVQCFFIAGNRDFLVREEFSQRSGFTILPDESVIDLYGQKTLLLHGDSLCTDDIAHQQFRAGIVNNPAMCEEFLSLAIPERIEKAKQIRMQSHQHKSEISMEIMDVTENTVLEAFTKFDVQQMIHGHTHRQATHHYQSGNMDLTRHVLGDWGETSSIITASADGLSIANKPI